MRRGTYEQYKQELLLTGKVEPVFQYLNRGGLDKVQVFLPNGYFLGQIKRSREGFWRFYAETCGSMYDDVCLTKIARELRRLNDADKGTTSRIHQ